MSQTTLASKYLKADQKEFYFQKDSVTTMEEFDELFQELWSRDWEVFGTIYNLSKLGWGLDYNNRKKSLGLCTYRSKKSWRSNQYELLERDSIWISKTLLSHNLDKAYDFEDTIRHEIAHAIHAEYSGRSNHGKTWKAIARQVGADDTRCHEGFLEKPKGKYTVVCDKCGYTNEKYRKPRVTRACGVCCNKHNNGRFDEKYKLRLVQNY
jgi:predicted SprT family Zn-dependent metalloprotease